MSLVSRTLVHKPVNEVFTTHRGLTKVIFVPRARYSKLADFAEVPQIASLASSLCRTPEQYNDGL